MGHWNENIYGGNIPLEWKENIYEFCKTKEYGVDDKPKVISKKKLTKNMHSIREMIDKVGEEDKEDMNIGYQIIGAICMNSGYDFSDSHGLKEKIIESIENDEWSKENGLRRTICNNFKKIIKEYDFNTPINIELINLLEYSEGKDEEEESVAKEFKEIFSLLNSRIKKLRNNIEEKSGNKDFDEGFETAAQEEIDFLGDFKELVARQEMLGVLFERISSGSIESSNEYNDVQKSSTNNNSIEAGRADVSPG